MLPGECLGVNGYECECGEVHHLQVCRSNAGYYLGYYCPEEGPISRETGYFTSRKLAEVALMETITGSEKYLRA